MKQFVRYAALAAALVLGSEGAMAASAPPPPSQDWSFSGIGGRFDRAALKRGYQVYAEVCSSCHSLKLVAYRNLAEIGFSDAQIREIASSVDVEDGPNDEGDMFTRPGLPADRFVPPFANDQAARVANGGALPPDLSLMVKARKKGPDYLYALMTGYEDEVPADFAKDYAEHHEGQEFALNDGMYFNHYFPGHQIAMPPPIMEEAVEYEDGTKATVDQMSRDVTVFLAWTASPELETRKTMGLWVVGFLILLTAMLYALKRKIWSDLH